MPSLIHRNHVSWLKDPQHDLKTTLDNPILMNYKGGELMPEVTVTINHEVGLHARPASIFVQTSAKYSSEIEVTHGETTANAKSILGVLTLGAHKDAEITIKAEGEDADEALKALEQLVLDNFGENE